MPVYLLHGFRWPRQSIRIHIILQNLDDAAAEWLVAPATTSALLNNFHELFPDCMQHLQSLRFVEQYDPTDSSESARSQPYAYVADVCAEIKLGIDVDDVRGKGVPNDQWAMMMELRDKLAPDAKVAWYVVVCGDVDRWAPGLSGSNTSVPAEDSAGLISDDDQTSEDTSEGQDDEHEAAKSDSQDSGSPTQTNQPKGFKKLLSVIARKKSPNQLRSSKSTESVPSTVRETTSQPSVPTGFNPGDDHVADHSLAKRSLPQSSKSNSSSEKAPSTIDDEARRNRGSQSEKLAQRTSMLRLQTHNLHNKTSTRTFDSFAQSPSSLSEVPDLEDDDNQEIITGPADEEDDSLAAPAPTVKHGKQQDLIARQRKRTSIHSLTGGLRGTSPDTLRNISPIVRNHPQSFSANSHINSSSELYSQYSHHDHHIHQLQREVQPEDIDEPASKSKDQSPPASYVPTGAPISRFGSVHTSRSSSPVKATTRQRSNSRLAALNSLEGNSAAAHANSPPKRTRATRSRRSSLHTNSSVAPRQSQYSMSSMSGTMAALYGNHERDFKNRQSVTQEDLVAKGMDNLDFGMLK